MADLFNPSNFNSNNFSPINNKNYANTRITKNRLQSASTTAH